MKVSGSYTVPFPREHTYQALQDPKVLAPAMPGCQTLEKTGENEYHMKMHMLVASLSGDFDGKVRISDQMPPSRFRLSVEGSGKIGFVKGQGLLTLREAAGGTEVSYEGDAQVGGTIAAVGQRLIDGTTKMLIRRFFEKLAEKAR
jgi:uncharacterized protein